MSKRANPTKVGLFIVIGVLLLVGGIIVFGSLRWFSPVSTFIIYFEEPAEGLEPGSPVKLRGVTIGRVKEVLIRFNQAAEDYFLPVLIEIDNALLQEKIDDKFDLNNPVEIRRAIENGLRARLELESLLTGRLYVSLLIDPQAPPPTFHQVRPIYPEIPSQLTELTQLKRTLVQLNVIGIAEKIESLLDRLNETLDGVQTRELAESALGTLRRLEALANNPEITNALVAVHRAADQFGRLAGKLEAQVDPLAGDARRTLDEAGVAMTEARKAMVELREIVGQRSAVRLQLNALLSNLADAAESVSALAEFLRRNPQALLSGRERPNP